MTADEYARLHAYITETRCFTGHGEPYARAWLAYLYTFRVPAPQWEPSIETFGITPPMANEIRTVIADLCLERGPQPDAP